MIDTVHLELEIQLDEAILNARHNYFKTTYKKGDEYHTWSNGRPRKGQKLLWNYQFKNDQREVAKLEIQVPSVAKLLDRDFRFVLPNVEMAILFINNYMHRYSGFGRVDVSEAKLRRIDFSYDYHVGDKVADYLSAIGSADYPHRDKSIFYNRWRFDSDKLIEGNGVTFFSEHDSTTFYSKEKQSKSITNHGILRQERILKTEGSIRSVTGLRSPKLSMITWDIAKQALSEDLAILSMDKEVASLSSVLAAMKKNKKNEKLTSIYGKYLILKEHRNLGKAELAKLLDVSERTVQRAKDAVEEVGISSATLADRIDQLPPLTLPERIPQPQHQVVTAKVRTKLSLSRT